MPELDPQLAHEAIRRARRWHPLAGLHPPQVAFLADPSKRKAALCTRRAGKTYALERALLQSASDHPGSISVYVTETRELARKILWEDLQRLDAEHRLGLKFDATHLEVRTPHGSQIWLTGAKDENEISKLRGPHYARVVLDESASFRSHMERLVFEVITPALMDLDGDLILAGTPGPRFDGLFYEVTRPEVELRRKGWSVHRWSVLENPAIPGAQAWIETEKAERGLTEQSPGFLREFRGVWVRSNEDLLVSGYDPFLNNARALPTGPGAGGWHYLLAVDPGLRRRSGFVVGAWSEQDPNLYLVHAEAKSHIRAEGGQEVATPLSMLPQEIADHIGVLRARFKPERIIMDCGGAGLSLAEEFRSRFRLPIEATDKAERITALEFLNGDLRAGRVQVLPGAAPLVDEWQTTRLDGKTGWADPEQRIDVLVAGLYLHRMSRHYWHRPEPKKRTVEDADWGEQVKAKWRDQREAQRAEFEEFSEW